ncbi:MAG: hypothetical protein WC776_05455 [Patescibacteria group bacterium]|jgi:hypothetical protein
MRKIGDKVWCVDWRQVPIQEPCPVCYGNKVVTVILGNEEHVECQCAYCQNGLGSDSRGYVVSWEYSAKPEFRTITGAEITSEGVSYLCIGGGGTYSHKENNVFDSEELANEKSKILAKEKTEEELERFLRRKNNEDRLRTYSWGIGYHKKEAERLKKEAQRHEDAMNECKKRKGGGG